MQCLVAEWGEFDCTACTLEPEFHAAAVRRTACGQSGSESLYGSTMTTRCNIWIREHVFTSN